jgi:hypothetical protein
MRVFRDMVCNMFFKTGGAASEDFSTHSPRASDRESQSRDVTPQIV